MEKYLSAVLFSILTAGLGAQGLVSQDNALEAPPSNIDLLRRAIQTNSPQTAPAQHSAISIAADAPVSDTQPVVNRPAEVSSSTVTDLSNVSKAISSAAVVSAVQPAVSQQTNVPTETEKIIEQNNALAKGEQQGKASPAASLPVPTIKSQPVPSPAPAAPLQAPVVKPQPAQPSAPAAAVSAMAQEELDYASRMLQQAKQENTSGRRIPPPAAQGGTVPTAKASSPNRPFNPNDYRPGVQWQRTNSKNFIIYTQKRDGGIGSSNMPMIFESAYATLRRNIPWMMSKKVRVFVYQDHNSYLKHEPNAKAWTRALAYPTRGEIVVYDEPGKQQELKEVFTHELVHIFTQQFFDKHGTDRLMTPEWLDEGLAVYMEDQAYNGTKGGPWGHDFKTLNIQRSKQSQPAQFSSASGFGRAKTFTAPGKSRKGKPVAFLSFDQMMQDGSLASAEGQGKAEQWYLQAYAMVRFLLNPAGGSSPSNRMQFEQFTRLISQGEQVRDPSTGFPVRGRNGKPVYQPYSVEKAMGRAYRYNSSANFEDAFWRWADSQR